jgi:hypothetical protein
MSSPELWIFGDSFADPNHDQNSYAWPIQLINHFNVKNFAFQGTGLDWSLQQFIKQTRQYKKEDLKSINILFLLSSLYRFNFSFLKPQDQVYRFASMGTEEADKYFEKNYIVYKKFYEQFLKYYIFHSSYEETEFLKTISYINLWSKYFNKCLIWNIFPNSSIPETIDVDLLPQNDKIQIIIEPLFTLSTKKKFAYGMDKRANHLDEHLHPIMVKSFVDFFKHNQSVNFRNIFENS